MSTEKEFKTKIFRMVLENKMKKELDEVGDSLKSWIKQYTPIFEQNPELVVQILIDSYIRNYQSDSHSFQFDFDKVLENTPEDSIDLLYESVISNFAKNFDISDINYSLTKE